MPLNRTLGWLLDPAASHGAGGLVLRSFARWLGADSLADEAALAQAWCEATPYRWPDGRKPDLVFRSPRAALLVENKVHAGEGDAQFADYASAFGAWAGGLDGTLILLAPSPLPAPDAYRFVSHAELAAWARSQADDPALPIWVRVALALLATDLTDWEPAEDRLRALVERSKRAALGVTDAVHLANMLARPRPAPWETR